MIKMDKTMIAIALTILLSGCIHDYYFDENKYKCTDGWWPQHTSKYGMEFGGLLNYDFENNPQEYYDDMAKELDTKLKGCGYSVIEGQKMYGCSVCYEWEKKDSEQNEDER